MKRTVALFTGLLLTLIALSQGKLKSDDLKDVLNRTLIVELVEDMHLADINDAKSYNQDIQKIIKAHWNLSSKVEFKTTSEIEELVKAKTTGYAILLITKSTMTINYKVGQRLRTNDDFRFTLNLVKVEDTKYSVRLNQITRYDGFAMPILHVENPKEIQTHELLLSIKLFQKFANTFIEGGSKLPINKFLKQEADKNCSTVTNQNLLIQDVFINYKLMVDDLNAKYTGEGKVIAAESDQIKRAIEESSTNLIGVAVPWRVMQAKSGTTVNTYIFYVRIFIDPSTMNVCTFHDAKPGGLRNPEFKAKEFGKILDCD